MVPRLGARVRLRAVACAILCLCASLATADTASGNETARLPRVGAEHIAFPLDGGSAQQEAAFKQSYAYFLSFWFDRAANGFREAAERFHPFPLAVLGEALSHAQALWDTVDEEAGQECIDRLLNMTGANVNGTGGAQAFAEGADLSPLARRDAAYIDAIVALYRPRSAPPEVRRDAFIAAMLRRVAEAPEDEEAKVLAALFLAARAFPGARGYLQRGRQDLDRAVELAQAVLRRSPRHPGALHALIHSRDAPRLAALAVDVGEAYGEAAPDSSHASHMPTHLHLRLGRFQDAEAGNREAVLRSERTALSSPLLEQDFHSVQFQAYALAQLGRFREARGLLEQRVEAARRALGDAPMLQVRAHVMRCSLALESGRWLQEDALPPLVQCPGCRAYPLAARGTAAFVDQANAAIAFGIGFSALRRSAPAGSPPTDEAWAAWGVLPAMPAGGAVGGGEGGTEAAATASAAALALAEEAAARLGEIAAKHAPVSASGTEWSRQIRSSTHTDLTLLQRALRAEIMAASGNPAASRAEYTAVTELARASDPPPYGPAFPPVPLYELFGAQLLGEGRVEAALREFEASLLNNPNRSLALLGAARAASALGLRCLAAARYAALSDNWAGADAEAVGAALAEARAFTASVGAACGAEGGG
eukprot:CAMPEP_0196772718 /NCGR_PEP_ID=MMETSP1104-20130614/2382_1 /TAXON_ID=33652 /ORGANISM="Cafeteria sp., Strain Caron Lab Isolate" /LENGTH=650 /DNA_ID=CAMNT_0042142859 /DNA_START=10 /DNA_END=1958 /DNA_ORIENTATION=+